MAESSADSPVDEDIESLEDATVRTVAELNEEIAAIIEETDDLYFDYVVGEVTDHAEANGNIHFDIDYEDASIHCTVFEYRRDELINDLEDGTQVAVAGDLDYYEARGSCSILVTDVVELGEGQYQQRYEENRATLAEDGLLDDQHKHPLPQYPETIGVVTSLDSDAREDAVTSIHDRYPDVDIIVRHATVQGADALEDLLEAISELDRDPEVDVIVVTRGGGAETTLRVFNELPLCRVIFQTETPIAVGIGHERDRTLADEVADERVMTPTDVGSVVPEEAALLETHEAISESLGEAYQRTVTRRLEETATALDDAYVNQATGVLTETQNEMGHALETLARERLTDYQNRLDHVLERIEQQEKYEQEKAAVEATYERRQRIQRIAIAVLLVLLVLLGAYVLFLN